MNPTPDIIPLAPAAVPQAAVIQTRAFFDDPAMAYIFPDVSARPQQLGWLMRLGIGYGTKYGRVDTTAGEMLGHAVWLAPGATSLTDEGMAEFGFGEAHDVADEGAVERLGAFMGFMDDHHHRLVREPHWYLMILGVEPDRQGSGIGSRLIAPMLANADSDGLPCYLETAKERNVPFYRRHGFELVHEEAVPGGGPMVWMMRRNAAPK